MIGTLNIVLLKSGILEHLTAKVKTFIDQNHV